MSVAIEARFQQAAIDYQQTVLNANKEVEKALIAFLKSQERAARTARLPWMPPRSHVDLGSDSVSGRRDHF